MAAMLTEQQRRQVLAGIEGGYEACRRVMQAYDWNNSRYLLAEHMRARMRELHGLISRRRDGLLDPGHSTKGVKPSTRDE